MDKEKVLVVLVGVSVFMLVVVVVAILWLYPGTDKPVSVVSAGETQQEDRASIDLFSTIRSGEEFPGLLEGEEPTGDGFIAVDTVYGQDTDTSSVLPSAPPADDREDSDRETVGDTSARDKAAVTVSARPVPTATPVKKSTPKPTPAPVQKTYKEYWIQIASFTSRSKAEAVAEELKSNGIVCRILTKTINGTVYYRVRLGPYNNKNEAEKFLSVVHSIKGYEKSYVSLVYKRS